MNNQADINQVTLQGTLPRDATYKQVGEAGTALISFTVMTTRKWVDPKTTEPKSLSQYNNVTAWRNLAESNKDKLVMGARVKVVGELTSRSWDDPQTGEKKYKTEVVASQITVMGASSSNSQDSSDDNVGGSDSIDAPITADDLPF